MNHSSQLSILLREKLQRIVSSRPPIIMPSNWQTYLFHLTLSFWWCICWLKNSGQLNQEKWSLRQDAVFTIELSFVEHIKMRWKNSFHYFVSINNISRNTDFSSSICYLRNICMFVGSVILPNVVYYFLKVMSKENLVQNSVKFQESQSIC